LSRRLALFDLDHTLLSGDSDEEWLKFLVSLGAVDASRGEVANADMMRRYREGSVGVQEFCEFFLQPYPDHPMERLLEWRERYFGERILPRIPRAARELVAAHEGDLVAVVTATNRFLTERIVGEFGVRHLVATEPEIRDGRFTGRVSGTPSFREGKVARVDAWLADRGEALAHFDESWFYSDSANDLPLLERVTHPVAVDPDPRLAAVALERGWRILELRREPAA